MLDMNIKEFKLKINDFADYYTKLKTWVVKQNCGTTSGGEKTGQKQIIRHGNE